MKVYRNTEYTDLKFEFQKKTYLFFSTCKEMANKFGNYRTKKQTYEVIVDVENALIVDCKGAIWNEINWKMIKDKIVRKYWKGGIELRPENIIKSAKNAGYDSIILKNIVEYMADEKPTTTIVILDYRCVKSVPKVVN